jgi:hypothetical protein
MCRRRRIGSRVVQVTLPKRHLRLAVPNTNSIISSERCHGRLYPWKAFPCRPSLVNLELTIATCLPCRSTQFWPPKVTATDTQLHCTKSRRLQRNRLPTDPRSNGQVDETGNLRGRLYPTTATRTIRTRPTRVVFHRVPNLPSSGLATNQLVAVSAGMLVTQHQRQLQYQLRFRFE